MTAGLVEVKNCVSIIRPLAERLQEAGLPVQLMGGVGKCALEHPATVIDPASRQIIAPAGLHLPNFRDDQAPKPSDRRDVDVFVVSTDPAVIDRTKQIVKDTIPRGDLKRDVFGIHPRASLQARVRHPFGLRVLALTWTGDRYMDAETIGEGHFEKALFPFSVRTPLEALEPWHTQIGDVTFDVPHPGMTILNYLTRSPAGLRQRNAASVHETIVQILKKMPEAREWIMDGSGRSQIELAGIFLGLRQPTIFTDTTPRVYGDKESGKYIEVRPVAISKLVDHDAFLLRDANPQVRSAALRLVRRKSLASGFVEDHKALSDIWLKRFMPLFTRQIHGK